MKRLYLAIALADAGRGMFARTRLKPRLTLRHDRGGVTALQYALLASLVAAPLAYAAPNLGTAVQNSFGKLSQIFEQTAGGDAGSPGALSFVQCRVEPAELDAGVRSGEPTVGPGARGISSAAPGRYVTLRCRVVAER